MNHGPGKRRNHDLCYFPQPAPVCIFRSVSSSQCLHSTAFIGSKKKKKKKERKEKNRKRKRKRKRKKKKEKKKEKKESKKTCDCIGGARITTRHPSTRVSTSTCFHYEKLWEIAGKKNGRSDARRLSSTPRVERAACESNPRSVSRLRVNLHVSFYELFDRQT